MKIHIKLIGILAFIALICLPFGTFGQSRFTQRDFFSYERFVPAMEILDAVNRQPGFRKDIKDFAAYFNDGLYALSNEKYSAALRKFNRSRDIWPEYFGTYFLIALTYEQSGNIRKASGFYKEYLNKLETLESGNFPISAPLINILNVDNMDTYYASKALIEERLRTHGIKLDDVKPPIFIAVYIRSALIIFISLLLFLAGYHHIWPYLKKQHHIKNPTPGFWVCKNCEKENPTLATECIKCGKPRR